MMKICKCTIKQVDAGLCKSHVRGECGNCGLPISEHHTDQLKHTRYHMDYETGYAQPTGNRRLLIEERYSDAGHYKEREVAAGTLEACQAAKRLLTMLTALVCLLLASGVHAQDAGVPDAGEVYPVLTVCISPYLISHDRQVMARAAAARGYDVIVGHSDACTVTVLAADVDEVHEGFMLYQETRKMHRGRATDLLIAWEHSYGPW